MVERFVGMLKYQHLFRCEIPDGDALAVETNLFPPDLQQRPAAPGAGLGDRTPGQAYLEPNP